MADGICIHRTDVYRRDIPQSSPNRSGLRCATEGDILQWRVRTRSTIGVSTFPLNVVLNDGGFLTQNRRNAILIAKTDVWVYLGHGIIRRGAI